MSSHQNLPPQENASPSRMRFGNLAVTVALTLCACFAALGLVYLATPDGTEITLTREEVGFLHDNSPLKVGIDRDFAPLQYADDKGKARGFSIDFLNLIGVNVGVSFEFIPVAWFELEPMLQRGEIDIISDMTPTDERTKTISFSSPVSSHQTHIFVLSHVVDIEHPKDLQGYRVAVPKGTAVALKIKSEYPAIIATDFVTSKEAINALLSGDVDAAIGYDFGFRHALFELGAKGIKQTGPPVTTEYGCIAVRKESATLLSIIDKGVNSIREEQKLSIQRKWVGTQPYHDSLQYLLEKHANWLAPIAAGVIGIALWNLILQIGLRKKAQAARDSNAQFSALYGSSHDAILIMKHRRIVDMNHIAETLLNISAQDAAQLSIPEILPITRDLSGAPICLPDMYTQAECGIPQYFESNVRLFDGRRLDLETRLNTFTSASEKFVVAQVRDITKRKTAEREMRKQRSLLSQLFEHSPLAVVMIDTNAVVQDVNKAFEQIFHFTRSEVLNQHIDSLIVAPEHAQQAGDFNESLLSGETIQHETTRTRSDGKKIHVHIAASPIYFEGELIGAYCIYSDVTQRHEAEEQLRHHAFYDKLTGLPNRTFLLQRLKEAIAETENDPDKVFALLYLDIDRFKVINESLGHPMGNMVIKAMANRVSAEFADKGFVSRVAGDEFAVLLTSDITVDSATRAARHTQAILRRPMSIAGHDIQPSAGLGLVMGPPEHNNAEFMLRDAEIALYRAKQRGVNSLEIFTPQMHTQAMKELETETELRRAVDNHEFILYYQPIIDLKTNTLAGFEALVRWNHPTYGIIPPGDFIPQAEETGLILGIGAQVLDMACDCLAIWQQQTTSEHLFMSINLSTHQFTLPDLSERIHATASAAGASLRGVKLEITESAVMENSHTAAHQLSRLTRLGIGLSLDDFGTGYSSLSYLQDFSLNTVKVDRSFVSRIGRNGENSEIIRAIIEMAHILDMDVIAEGVEEEFQAEILRSFGCDFVQGYLYAKPLPETQADEFIKRFEKATARAIAPAAG